MIRLPASSRGAEKQPGNPSPAVAVGDARHDHDAAQARRVEQPLLDRLPERDHRGRVERGLLGDVGVVPVDPLPPLICR